jgi:hypothetical protein
MVLEVAYQSELILDIVKMDDELHVVGVAVVLIVVAEAAAEHLVENEDGDPGQQQSWNMHHVDDDEWHGESDLSGVIHILIRCSLFRDHGTEEAEVDPLDDPLGKSVRGGEVVSADGNLVEEALAHENVPEVIYTQPASNTLLLHLEANVNEEVVVQQVVGCQDACD